TYMDKTGRNGLRVGDTTLPDFQQRYEKLKAKHLEILSHYGEIPDFSEKEAAFMSAIDFIKTIPHVDAEHLVNNYLKEGKKVVGEGAQGTVLDVDSGSYPFGTSSHTTTAGACTELGIAHNKVDAVYGILYKDTNRVGGGPCPTELYDET